MPIRSIPQQFMFTDKMVIIAGSDFAPRLWDGVNPPTIITNTFTALYPAWLANTTYLVGDLVIATPTTGFYYKCVQAGKSAGAQPAFPVVVGQRVADNQVLWECTAKVTTSPAPPGAAHGIVYAGSLWVFGTSPTNDVTNLLDGPSALRMSDVNNPTSWNPLNAAFIGKDDGTQSMGLASFTIAESGIPPLGTLIAFKEFNTYQITGVFGSPNFSIQRIQSDMGNLAPRSIQFLPGFGVIRLSHLGFAIFDGVRDRVVSEEIRPYLFGGQPDITSIDWTRAYLSRGGLISKPPMYACLCYKTTDANGPTRLFLFDLVLKSWSIIDLPASAAFFTYLLQSGTMPISILGGYNNGYISSFQKGQVPWWNNLYQFSGGVWDITLGLAVPWHFRTPEVFSPSDPTQRIYFRGLSVRGARSASNNGVLQGSIGCTVYFQGEEGTVYDRGLQSVNTSAPNTSPGSPYPPIVVGASSIGGAFGGQQFEAFFDLGEIAINAHAVISGFGFVEIESVTWYGEPLTPSVPARLGR